MQYEGVASFVSVGMQLAVIWADLVASKGFKCNARFVAAIQRDALEYAAQIVEASGSLNEAARNIRIAKGVTK